MNSAPRPLVLFAFLGTGKYEAVHYRLGERQTAARETFTQAALLELLVDERPTQVRIAVTPGAIDAHGNALEQHLTAKGLPAAALSWIHIHDGKTEGELWENFRCLVDGIPQGARVVFDVTHGFRSLPLLGALAMLFLRHVKGIQLEAVLLGAFEARDGAGVAPVFNLTPLFDLPAWTEAVASWKQTGRPDALIARTQPHTSALKRRLQKQAPGSLTSLPAELLLLGDALRLTRHDQVAILARGVHVRLEQASRDVRSVDSLSPLVPVFAELESSLWPLLDGPGDVVHPDAVYLRHQLALARWYGQTGDLTQALTILSELLSSCAVVAARLAGVDRLPDQAGVLPDASASLDKITVPLRSTALFLATTPSQWSRQTVAPSRQFLHWLEERPELAAEFERLGKAISAQRNKVNHAWTRPESRREKFRAGVLQGIRETVDDSLRGISGLIDTLTTADGVRATVNLTSSGAVHLTGVFLNLSNHPVSGWSPGQLAAARALGHGEPTDLPGGLPPVDPEASEDDVQVMADRIVAQAHTLGARGAHVAGEFTLTMALVQALQRAGVPCLAATTRREVLESPGPDGTVTRTSAFQFVRWRPYTNGSARMSDPPESPLSSG